MIHVFVRHHVADYVRWKEAFDSHLNLRKDAGETAAMLYQSVEDPRDLYLLFEFESIQHARKYMSSDELRKAMAEAGVQGTPEIKFLEPAATMRRSSAD
jgi:quinol monooxygenase YgiN